jgi:hypothetical protein
MIDPASFENCRLWGGFNLTKVELTPSAMVDALEREAIAQTRIVGMNFSLQIRSGLTEYELSVTFYHEVLEEEAVASSDPPASVIDFNEADFERTAYAMHDRFGAASPENLSRMLQFHGFREK